MPIQYETLDACEQDATEMQATLALSVLNLFQSTLVPTASTVKADFVAAVATYDAYAPITLTAWNNPILAPGSGYMIGSPLAQFDVGAVDPVTPNTIGGCWVEDAAGNVRLVVIFDAPVPMQLAGQGIPLNLVEIFPTGY